MKSRGFGVWMTHWTGLCILKPENVSPSCRDIIVQCSGRWICIFNFYACMFWLFAAKKPRTLPLRPCKGDSWSPFCLNSVFVCFRQVCTSSLWCTETTNFLCSRGRWSWYRVSRGKNNGIRRFRKFYLNSLFWQFPLLDTWSFNVIFFALFAETYVSEWLTTRTPDFKARPVAFFP